eukprot:1144434-Pelagomonas_calceolata.AAC.4
MAHDRTRCHTHRVLGRTQSNGGKHGPGHMHRIKKETMKKLGTHKGRAMGASTDLDVDRIQKETMKKLRFAKGACHGGKHGPGHAQDPKGDNNKIKDPKGDNEEIKVCKRGVPWGQARTWACTGIERQALTRRNKNGRGVHRVRAVGAGMDLGKGWMVATTACNLSAKTNEVHNERAIQAHRITERTCAMFCFASAEAFSL